jgi:hypothetical protein
LKKWLAMMKMRRYIELALVNFSMTTLVCPC